MKTTLRLTFAAFVLAAFNLSAATPARLFVALSQEGTYSSESSSVIVAFDLDGGAVPVQKEFYICRGTGDSNHSQQEICLDNFGKHLFFPNNLSSNLSVYGVTTEGRLIEVSESPIAAGPEPAFTTVHPNRPYLYLG